MIAIQTNQIPEQFHWFFITYQNMMNIFLIQEVAKQFDGNIRVVPLTKENYISFTAASENQLTTQRKYKTIIRFKFIDSLKFMASALDKLA